MTDQRRDPATTAGSDYPTEAIAAMVAPRRSGGEGPIDLPEIVPATAVEGAPSSASASEPTQSLPLLGGPEVTGTADAIDPHPEGQVPRTEPTRRVRIGRRPRVRRVNRVVRHIDPWSVFKVALLFHIAAYIVALTSGVMIWRVAEATGTLDNVERWFTQFGWESFEFDGGEIFRSARVAGLFVVVGLTGLAVLTATVFNLISDLVGGVRVAVLEEEVVVLEEDPTGATPRAGAGTGAGTGAGASPDPRDAHG